jgi:hypothetical protein
LTWFLYWFNFASKYRKVAKWGYGRGYSTKEFDGSCHQGLAEEESALLKCGQPNGSTNYLKGGMA